MKMEFLYDWQFWGVVLGGLGIITTFIIFQLQKNRKRLSYSVLTETPLLSIDETVKGKITIRYDRKKIENIYLVIISINNTGNTDILSTDFERPLTFSFPDSEILSVEVVNTSPKNLQPEIVQNLSTISLNPILLNKTDFVEFKLLFSVYKNVIHADARIAGLKEIYRVSQNNYVFEILDSPIVKGLVLSFSLTPLYFLLNSSETPHSLIFFALSIVTIIFIWLDLKQNRNKH